MFTFDLPKKLAFAFQDPASPIINGIIDLHHGIFFYLILILTPVLFIFFRILIDSHIRWHQEYQNHIETFRKNYLIVNNLVHGTILEIIWTIIPAIILMFIAVPSFALLYSIDEIIDPKYTIKVLGNQWYWHYETPNQASFDSYMKPTTDLISGQLRLLEVDSPLILPINTHLRFIISAVDVLHSFAVPSLGIKVDDVPGRLNQVATYIQREGVFIGQCSELCGVNHGFMPIQILGISANKYETLI